MKQLSVQEIHHKIDLLNASQLKEVELCIANLESELATKQGNNTEEKRKAKITEAVDALVSSNVAHRFGNVTEWQKEARKDRELPRRGA